MRRLLLILLGFLAVAASLLAVGALALNSGPGRAFVAGLVERYGSTPGAALKIGRLSGTLPFEAVVEDVTLADVQGVWARLDRGRLVWRPFELVSRVVDVERLELGRLELARRPAIAPQPAQPASESAGASYGVRVERLAADEIVFAQNVLGLEARVMVEGRAELVDPERGLTADLKALRTDGTPGSLDLSLAYRPDSERITLSLAANEPAGGLMARLLAIEGLPPVALTLTGEGTLDDLAGRLALDAGPSARAGGRLRVEAVNGVRRATVDLDGRIDAIMPAPYRPLVNGPVSVSGRGTIDDARRLAFERLDVRTPALTAALRGTLDVPGQGLDVTFELTPQAAEPFAPFLPEGIAWEGLAIAGTAAGAWSHPQVKARVTAASLAAPQGRTGALSADVDVRPTGALGAAQTRVPFTLALQAADVVLADPDLAAIAGGQVKLSAQGTAEPAALAADLTSATLDLAPATLRFAGRIDPQRVRGRLDANEADLARLAPLLGRPLAGVVTGSADIDLDLSGGRVSAHIQQATARDPRTGIAQLDGLLGAQARASGGVVREADGRLAFSSFALEGQSLSLRADGGFRPDAMNLQASLSLPRLEAADPRLTGAATARVSVTGSVQSPRLSGEVNWPSGTLMGRPVDRLVAQVEAADLFGSPSGRLTVKGAIDRFPLDGGGRILTTADGTRRVEDLSLVFAGLTLRGSGALTAAGQPTARLAVSSEDLSTLGERFGLPLGGRTNLTVDLPPAGDLTVRGESRAVTLPGVEVGALTVDMRVTDPMGTRGLQGTLEGRTLKLGETAVEAARVVLSGTAEAATVDVTGKAMGFDIAALASTNLLDPARITVRRLSAEKERTRLTLNRETVLLRSGGGVRLDKVEIAVGSGRITIDGLVGPTLDADLRLADVPLAALELVKPGLGLQGTANGTATLEGPIAAPRGRAELRVSGLSLPATRAAGLSALSVEGRAELDGTRAAIDARITGPNGLSASLDGRVPLGGAGNLDVAVRGRLDAALASPFLGEARLTGPITIDGRVTGTTATPRIEGQARLSNGSFTDPGSGLTITNLQAAVRGSQQAVEIERVTGSFKGGGSLNGSGRITLDAGAGFPGRLSLQLTDARIDSEQLKAALDGQLEITGTVARQPVIAGTITVRTMEIVLANRLPGSAKQLDVKHKAAPAPVQAQAARLKQSAARRQSSLKAELDLKVLAQNRVFVRGQGLEAELGGELTLKGPAGSPATQGGFDLRRGTFNVLGQVLTFTSGKAIFDGTTDPLLDLAAEARSTDVRAEVAVTGRASAPEISFRSEPSLPEDEVMARVLFGRGTGELTPGQAVRVATALTQISGFGGGAGALDKVRRSFGLDSLGLTSDSRGGVGVGINRYINNNISVGVSQGAGSSSSRVQVDIDLTRNIRARAEAGANGDARAGVSVEWDY